MASITLEVEIGDLDNSELNNFDEKFYIWLRQAYKNQYAPAGTLDDVHELDRQEDEGEEEE